MNDKRPRRTSDRILDVALVMFNRFGESNVSTSQLCAELGISPGNLFYHHPTRDALVAGLFARYEGDLVRALAGAAGGVQSPAAWQTTLQPGLVAFAQLADGLARSAWAYRFLFRDLSDLVSRHRVLEEGMPALLRRQAAAIAQALRTIAWLHHTVDEPAIQAWCGPLLATLTGCLGLDGALDPRERLRSGEDAAVARAVGRALAVIRPALPPDDRQALRAHLSRGDELGPDPWWLHRPDG